MVSQDNRAGREVQLNNTIKMHGLSLAALSAFQRFARDKRIPHAGWDIGMDGGRVSVTEWENIIFSLTEDMSIRINRHDEGYTLSCWISFPADDGYDEGLLHSSVSLDEEQDIYMILTVAQIMLDEYASQDRGVGIFESGLRTVCKITEDNAEEALAVISQEFSQRFELNKINLVVICP